MMSNIAKKRETSDWTGEPDPLAAEILALVLIIGVIGFLIIGAIAMHG